MQTRNSNIRIRTDRKDGMMLHDGRDALKLGLKRPNSVISQLSLPGKHLAAPKNFLEQAHAHLDREELQNLLTFRSQRAQVRSTMNRTFMHMAEKLFGRSDCGEFQETNFNYLQDRELDTFPLAKEYLSLKTHDINPRMRYIIINWLVDVHKSYQLTPESLYLTVTLMDRYLHRTTNQIKKDQFQLLGLTALYVASKFEEIFPPEINDFVAISDNSVTKEQIKACEKDLLKTLGFTLSFPSPIVFLRRLTSALDAQHVMHNLSKYLLELSIQEYELAHLPGNKRAAISVCIARALCEDSEDLSLVWSEDLVFLTGLKLDDFVDDLRVLARAAYRQNTPSKYRAIKNKYAETDSLGRVADLPILRSELLERVACIEFESE